MFGLWTGLGAVPAVAILSALPSPSVPGDPELTAPHTKLGSAWTFSTQIFWDGRHLLSWFSQWPRLFRTCSGMKSRSHPGAGRDGWQPSGPSTFPKLPGMKPAGTAGAVSGPAGRPGAPAAGAGTAAPGHRRTRPCESVGSGGPRTKEFSLRKRSGDGIAGLRGSRTLGGGRWPSSTTTFVTPGAAGPAGCFSAGVLRRETARKNGRFASPRQRAVGRLRGRSGAAGARWSCRREPQQDRYRHRQVNGRPGPSFPGTGGGHLERGADPSRQPGICIRL